MKTIKSSYQAKQVIQKSEFICNLYPVNSAEEANTILATVRKTYYDSTHNCYAYIIGQDGDICKYSDDGEPSQTAGVVIYDVLKKNNLTNVLAVVTRWFGGIKLGAGGLVRAYSSSCALAISLITSFELTECYTFELESDYSLYNNIKSAIFDEVPYTSEVSSKFLDKIYLQYWCKVDDFPSLVKRITTISKGSVKLEIVKRDIIAI